MKSDKPLQIRRSATPKEVEQAMKHYRELWSFPKLDRHLIATQFRSGDTITDLAQRHQTSPAVIEEIIRSFL